MIKFSQKYFKEIIIFLLICLGYFLLRLPNLTLQPIFADEAIYIRWAQVMRAEPTLRFLPLSDGKTPLFMWAMIPLFKIFSDPLFAGRFLSVISGFITLLGVFFLGWRFFNLKAAFWGATLVAVTPFMVFFDRMALADSMLTAFSIWALNFALMVVRFNRIDTAMVLGYCLGGALLTKTPGVFNILVLPFSIIALNWKATNRQQKILKIFGLWLIALIIAGIIYNLLRLGPGFDNLSSRNQDYIFSPWELKGRPLDPFLPHFSDVREWFSKLIGWPTTFLILAGTFLMLIKKNRYAIVVFLWGVIPLLVEMAFLKTFTARYILFSIPPLLMIAAWALSLLIDRFQAKKLIINMISLLIILPTALFFDLILLQDPARVNLPVNDRKGYFEEWTAGYGFPEIAQYLINEAKTGPVLVSTEGFFGTLPDGLAIYLEKYFHHAPKNQQIVVIGGRQEVPQSLWEEARKQKTFFVANKSRFSTIPEGLELIKEFPKAAGKKQQDAILLFKVLPITQ